MTPAATELGSQFLDRKTQQFIHRKFFKDPDDALFNLPKTDSLLVRCLEFLAQNGSRNAQQMTAMFEVGRGWCFFNQPVTFDGQRRGGRKKLRPC